MSIPISGSSPIGYPSHIRRASQPSETPAFTLPSLDDQPSSFSRFDEKNPIIADLLLSHIDMVPANPQRSMGVVADAVKNYHAEIDTLPEVSQSESKSLLASFFSKVDNASINHYHAISRLYASVYSQFPNEADLHIDHDYIEKMNQDVWNGKNVTPSEIERLSAKMDDLLVSVGYPL